MTNAAGVADVAVIGLGYIGLPTAAVLARAGESPSRAASFNPPAADASSPPCSGPASPPPGLPAADALPAWPTSPARLGLPPGEFVFPLIERSSLTIDETPFGHCDSAI